MSLLIPLVLNFTNPYPLPANGFLVKYRPKGSTDPYFTYTSMTGSPIRITDNILADTDYEGTVQVLCSDTTSSPEVSFATSNF